MEPLYTPSLSLGEGVVLRVIAGNVRPTQILAMLDGASYSKRFALKEVYPTVFEAVLKAQDFRDILTNDTTKYKIKFYITIDNREYTYITEDIVHILGLSFGMENLTDVSELYARLNDLKDELHNRS